MFGSRNAVRGFPPIFLGSVLVASHGGQNYHTVSWAKAAQDSELTKNQPEVANTILDAIRYGEEHFGWSTDLSYAIR